MTDLIRLAERVEALAGPSFEVDKAILAALGYTWRGMNYWSADNKKLWKGPTNFTESLDAAMTLVPKNMQWSCGFSKHVPHNAQVWTESGFYESECDSNRACALTAASLRSLAAQRGQG